MFNKRILTGFLLIAIHFFFIASPTYAAEEGSIQLGTLTLSSTLTLESPEIIDNPEILFEPLTVDVSSSETSNNYILPPNIILDTTELGQNSEELVLDGGLINSPPLGLPNGNYISIGLSPEYNGKKGEMDSYLVRLAKQDLSSRFGIELKRIKVERTVERTWNDASLGCPEEGMYYAQVLTPGYEIIFKVNGKKNKGKRYVYHTDTIHHVKFCFVADKPKK